MERRARAEAAARAEGDAAAGLGAAVEQRVDDARVAGCAARGAATAPRGGRVGRSAERRIGAAREEGGYAALRARVVGERVQR